MAINRWFLIDEWHTNTILQLNNLDGSFPSLFSNLQYLTYLDLSHNAFSGPITSLLTNLQHVTYLDLSYNEFSGSIPSFLANLQHLTHLDLSFNAFSGPVPNFLGQLTKLQKLILSNNNLGGKLLLSSLANYSTQIFILDCSHNKFQGPLPNTITDLSNNQFTGHMSAISSHSLQALSLCGNKLQGNVPESMFNLALVCYSTLELFMVGLDRV
ncbi:hypothetical protein Ahy_A07g031201 [Arachis hypogaea]|uniref:Non-specific serine/threonine protein kinase n=1 Tax=Arachis hypogaea TaxID=3818 RepID=A0A445C358_ARAHY|nr:hypothetical protein Ahy_A07g031201 [Arachis hypogaea]